MAEKKADKKTDKEGRLIGVVIPVGALRTEKSIGVGEFSDLAEFGALCVKMGIGLIQLLPVNDTGSQSSPYFALTAFALHPLYIRIGDLPESDGYEAAIQAIKEKHFNAVRFSHEAVYRDKMGLLRTIYDANKDKIAASSTLKTWIEANPWVKPYAVFRRIKEANAEKSWVEWNIPDATVAHTSALRINELWKDPSLMDEHLFWAWIQMALDTQFSAAVASLAGLGIKLLGDLPILMNEDSCDVWAHQKIFNLHLSAGAPPDMYSPEGQNWGFPIYDWKAQTKDNYAWWKDRLKVAEKYFQAYRIDHVLGFFRIWASRREDKSALMGRYVPSIPITAKDFEELRFDSSRIRWVCEPHIQTGEIWDAVKEGWNGGEGELNDAVRKVFESALNRIGDEELWLFRENIRGEKDIAALDIHPGAKTFLLKSWENRIFFEYEKGEYFPVWNYIKSRAYASLSEEEKKLIKTLLEKHRLDSEKIWEVEGKKLLSVLTSSTSMLPCAEDLGAVPPCVPKVLAQLNILGLRVVRWHREWAKEGQPYIPFEDYPELSICTPAVHDSSCLREWWDREADQKLFAGFLGVPSLPKVYNPGTARIILTKIASAVSRFRVFQIQDLLHLSNHWYAADAASERINVPGTDNTFNWTYRLPALISELAKDEDLIRAVSELAAVKPAVQKKAKK